MGRRVVEQGSRFGTLPVREGQETEGKALPLFAVVSIALQAYLKVRPKVNGEKING
jgi:hypothetical protein